MMETNDIVNTLENLCKLDGITRLGAEPPKRTPDFKGYFIEGMTKLRSKMDNEQALKARETQFKKTA